MSVISLEKTRSVSFKNEQLSCTFLKIDSLDMSQVSFEIKSLTERAPNLLNSLPLILDCQPKHNFSKEEAKQFLSELSLMQLNIVGIVDHNWGLQTPWPLISNNKKPKIKSITNLKTKIVEHRIRSGEVIEALDAHLMILGSVGSGAEIYATGNIYVYGSLQGRAFAGMGGAEEAFIIAQSIDAEMLAIAGIYSVNDDSQKDYSGNLKVYLDDGALNYKQVK